MDLDVSGVDQLVSTGSLPGWEDVERLVAEAYARNRDVRAGTVADYIPVLARVDPDLFAVCVAEVDGAVHDAGNTGHAFSIQSISKAFVYALVCDVLGHEAVLERVGVNNTWLAFNSVMAVELNGGHPMNPCWWRATRSTSPRPGRAAVPRSAPKPSCAGTRWRSWPRAGCTSAPASGCSRSGCPASPGCRAAS